MDENHHVSETRGQFLGELLRATAGDLGVKAARRLVEEHPVIAARYEPLPACKWKDTFVCWTMELSAALSAGCSGIFARHMAWTRSAFKARGVPVEDLKAGLAVLRETLVSQLEPGDHELANSYFDAAVQRVDSPCCGCGQSGSAPLSTDTVEGRLGASYLLALLEGDRREASRLITTAAKSGMPVRDIYLCVLWPVLKELGRMWELAEIDVAEEHFATATTELVMAQLYPFLQRKASNGRTVIAATTEGNQHELGVRMAADFFEMEGWRAVYLGAGVPADELAMAVVDFKADVLVISACMHAQLQAVGDAVRAVRSVGAASGVKVVVGGPGFAETGEIWRTMGADGFATTVDKAVEVAEGLLESTATRV
jgi:methanogenic corrinoid protein MtbC1